MILDECVGAGLQYEIEADSEFTVYPDDATCSEECRLAVVGHEAALPWAAVLAAGRDGPNR